tara:strand:+ start:247 stop:498 length:252 start_codon:yes stop_codon:yes gene_type:complete
MEEDRSMDIVRMQILMDQNNKIEELKQEISDLQYERKHTLGLLSDTREKWYTEYREHEISKQKIESLEKEVSRLKLNLETKKE